MSSQKSGVRGYLAAQYGQTAGAGTNWWPWILLLITLIGAAVLYYRMDSYRKRVHDEESLPQHDLDDLQRRLDHLPDRTNDYQLLCYRLARGAQSGRRAVAYELDELESERRTDARSEQ
jgi:hypothetical protein